MYFKIFICRKDDDWKLSRGVYIFVIIGLLLLLGAISALIVVIKPWTVSAINSLYCVELINSYLCTSLSSTFLPLQLFCLTSSSPLLQIGVAFLLVLLLMVLAIGAIHHWASNNFYLSRIQMVFVCFLAFLLALAAFLVGRFEGASYVYFISFNMFIFIRKWLIDYCCIIAFCFSGKPFVGASVGYFLFLSLLAGRALTVSYLLDLLTF